MFRGTRGVVEDELRIRTRRCRVQNFRKERKERKKVNVGENRGKEKQNETKNEVVKGEEEGRFISTQTQTDHP